MRDFNVLNNIGSFNQCSHPFRISFLFQTLVLECERPIIPLYGLTITKFDKIATVSKSNSVLIGNHIFRFIPFNLHISNGISSIR